MMIRNLVVSGAALTVSISAVAQAGPEAQKSSEQIICEISGDCSAVDSSLANKERPEERGFRIVGPSAAPKSAPAVTPSTSHLVTPAKTSAQRVVSRQASGGRSAVRHSDLAINFVSGSAALTDSGKSQADQFLKAMAAPQLSGKRFRVVGHTDSVGGKDYNIDLSRRRAESVVDYLVQNGASRDVFETRGVGFSDPVDGTNPADAVNRRVEFVPLSR